MACACASTSMVHILVRDASNAVIIGGLEAGFALPLLLCGITLSTACCKRMLAVPSFCFSFPSPRWPAGCAHGRWVLPPAGRAARVAALQPQPPATWRPSGGLTL